MSYDPDILQQLDDSASFADSLRTVMGLTGSDAGPKTADALRYMVLLSRALEPHYPELSHEEITDLIFDTVDERWRFEGLSAVGGCLLSRSAYEMADDDPEIRESILEMMELAMRRVVMLGVQEMDPDKVEWFFGEGE